MSKVFRFVLVLVVAAPVILLAQGGQAPPTGSTRRLNA